MKDNVIVVASAKGGVGKTTVATNTAATLAAEYGKSVLLVDGNLTGANAALNFGINYPKKTIADFVGGSDITKLVCSHQCGVDVIAGPVDLDPRISPLQLEEVVKEARQDYDFVIIDSAPNLGAEAVTAIKSANKVIGVCTPSIPSIMLCVKTLELAEGLGKKTLAIVMNRIQKKGYETKIGEAKEFFRHKVPFFSIAETSEIPKSLTLQQPLVLHKPNHRASKEFKKITALIVGQEYKNVGILGDLRLKLRIPKFGNLSSKEKIERKKRSALEQDILGIEKLKQELEQDIKRNVRFERQKKRSKKKRKIRLRANLDSEDHY